MKSTHYKIMALNKNADTELVGRETDRGVALDAAKKHCRKSGQFTTVWKVEHEFEAGFDPE